MMDYNSVKHNQERHKDFVLEAEQDRLARIAQRARAAERREHWLNVVDSFRCHFAHFRYSVMTRAGLRREPALC